MSVKLETLRPERVVFAQVSVPQQVRLQAPFAGWVEAVPVKPGMVVAPGDLLLRLDDTDARALLAQAQADVADLEAQIRIEQLNMAAQKKLVARKLVNELSVEQLQAKLAQLNARLEKARARLLQVQRDTARQ
jgi:multidrug resistance efflux pump